MSISNFFNFGKKPKFTSEITKSNRTKILDGSVITNSTKVLDHTVNVIQMNAFKSNKKPITQSGIDELNTEFGKYNTTFKGSEYKYKIWMVDFEGYQFDIFTAKGYGTQVSVNLTNEQIWSGEFDDMLIAFSDKLFEIFNRS